MRIPFYILIVVLAAELVHESCQRQRLSNRIYIRLTALKVYMFCDIEAILDKMAYNAVLLPFGSLVLYKKWFVQELCIIRVEAYENIWAKFGCSIYCVCNCVPLEHVHAHVKCTNTHIHTH